MQLGKPKEDHLEAILILGERDPVVRRIDVANFLGKSKATVTVAINLLIQEGYIKETTDAALLLTDAGWRIADPLYERWCFFRDWLMQQGVDPDTADREAHALKHAISPETFERIRTAGMSREANAV